MMMLKEAPSLMKKKLKVNQMIRPRRRSLRRMRRMKPRRIMKAPPLITQEICRLSLKSRKSSWRRRVNF